MDKLITKTHALYGNVRFLLDYDNKYKPLAKDILDVTGNYTVEKYNPNSLLEKRELYRLLNASENNIELFKDWIYKLYNKLNNDDVNSLLFKNEIEILNTITADDFAIIDIHPFSCNKMYEANDNKIQRTPEYNNWWNNFPTDQLIKFSDIDFNKPVFLWYYFKSLPSYDIENLLKPTSDKICDFLATTDENFKHFKIDGEYVKSYKDGKIYVFMCNIEDQYKSPFK